MLQIDKPLLSKLLKGVVSDVDQHDAVVGHLARALGHVEDIDHKARVAREKLRRELARHDDAKRAIESEIKQLQDKCGHPQSIYCGDPAGGSDSFHSCNICGAQWR
jgi:hypothetical protein